MTRLLRPLLLVAALLFSQHAAMLHGLAHAQYDVELATQGGKAPALGHAADVCVAFGALANAIGDFAVAFAAETIDVAARALIVRPYSAPTRVVFDSRAPPSFS